MIYANLKTREFYFSCPRFASSWDPVMETSLDYFYKCDDRNDRIYRATFNAISSGTLDISIIMSYSVSSSNKYL